MVDALRFIHPTTITPATKYINLFIYYAAQNSSLSLCANDQVCVETLHATSLRVAQTYGFKAKKGA